jgi:hypothetical protein
MSDPQPVLIRIQRAALTILLVSMWTPGWASTRGPDSAGYTATDAIVYSFVDVSGSGGGASILTGIDDATAPLTLPFAFSFYGRTYSVVCASSNGALYFVPDAAACAGLTDFANVDIASTATPNDLAGVFPLWSDLTFQEAGGGAVFYQTLGAAGSRRFVVQWNDAYPAGSPSPVTFQVVLAEGTNSILFQYKIVDLGDGNPASRGAAATIGIRNAGGPATNTLIEWSFNAPVLGDATAIRFTGDSAPPVTTAAVSGPTGSNGWFRGAVQVTLSATDSDGRVSSTSYSIDGGTTQVYAGAFTVSGDGVHHVSFFSVDSSQNKETPKQLDVKIDQTAPVVTAAANPRSLWPPNGKTVNVTVDPSTARFTVVDSFGRVQPSGAIAVGPAGAYSVVIPLVADTRDRRDRDDRDRDDRDRRGSRESDSRGRDGSDRDERDEADRTYTVTVRAADLAGNSGSAVVVVKVLRERDR